MKREFRQRCRGCDVEHTFSVEVREPGRYEDVARECPSCGELLRFSVRFEDARTTARQ